MPNSTRPCEVQGCSGTVHGHNYCVKHYKRWKKNGDPQSRRQGTCSDCQETFTAAQRGSIPTRCAPCSHAFSQADARRRTREAYVPVRNARSCTDCGQTYDAPGRDTNSLRCIPCRAAEKRRWKSEWAKRNPDKVMTDIKRLRLKAAKHRRRVIERGTRHDYFTAPEIFERDGWACQICGILIDPDVKFPSRDSASLDHIIPLALGGTHTLDNVQLACMGCNWDKGARSAA